MIFDERGRTVGAGDHPYARHHTAPHRVEQDMEDVWIGLRRAAHEALAGLDPRDVASIAVASQRGTFLMVDRDMRLLGPAIVWSDRRADAEAAELVAQLGPGEFERLTGTRMSGTWSCAKLRWVMQRDPARAARIWKVLNGQEWLLWKLGARTLATEVSSLSMNGMLRVSDLDWCDEVLAACGLDREQVPPLTRAGSAAGQLSAEAADATGFAAGTPLFFGGGDQQCAAVGAGALRPGQCILSIGTGAVSLAPVGFHRPGPEPDVIQGAHAHPRWRAVERIALATGSCVQWWRDVAYGAAAGGSDVRPGYAALDAEAARAHPCGQGLLFLPYFAGRCTGGDAAPGGAFLGLGPSHGRAEMSRAVLEGVTLELRRCVDDLESFLGERIEAVRVMGGGARSDVWMSLAATALDRILERLEVRECTSLGAALLGAVGVGHFADLEEAAEAAVHRERIFAPDPELAGAYRELYRQFIEATDGRARGG